MSARNASDMKAMLALVERAWREHPSWRFGQLVANAAAHSGSAPWTDSFYVNDEAIAAGLRHFAPAETTDTTRLRET